MESSPFCGIRLSVTDVQRNKEFLCDEECYRLTRCDLKRALSLSPTKRSFVATAVTINVRNTSESGWLMRSSQWELVDGEDLAYGASNVCDVLRPPRMKEVGGWTVSPGTQVNFLLLFPELEVNSKIARLLFVSDTGTGHDSLYTFTIQDCSAGCKPTRCRLSGASVEIEVPGNENEHYELYDLNSTIDDLDRAVFARLNNALNPGEIRNMENNIQNMFYEVGKKLEFMSKGKASQLNMRYMEIKSRYDAEIDSLRDREVRLSQRVSSLSSLTPTEFEEYVAQMFAEMGYESIELTPPSNDQGVDIIMHKEGKKYVVQCKKQKGIVGSPAIQTFLGALHHAQADTGFFVTTSTFSLEAEKIAMQHPIELVDSVMLVHLIEHAVREAE